MISPKFSGKEYQDYSKPKQQVIEELQSIINRINNIQYTQIMCMSTRKSGDWQETIITGFQDPDTIVINIFTQLEGQL